MTTPNVDEILDKAIRQPETIEKMRESPMIYQFGDDMEFVLIHSGYL